MKMAKAIEDTFGHSSWVGGSVCEAICKSESVTFRPFRSARTCICLTISSQY